MSTIIPFPSRGRSLPVTKDDQLKARLKALFEELETRPLPAGTDERLDALTARVERLEAALQPTMEPRS